MVDAGVPLRVITSAALPVKAAYSTPPVVGAGAIRRPGHGVEAELVDGVPGDRGLAGSGIAEHPEHRLLCGAVLEPVHHRLHCLMLLIGKHYSIQGVSSSVTCDQVRPLAMA